MSKVIAIFGAGPGLGLSVAHRFGREGYRVALLARDAARLDGFVADLGAAGIEAAAFPAELTDRAGHTDLTCAVVDRLGPVDVALLNGFVRAEQLRPATELDVEAAAGLFDALSLAQLSLVRRLLPGMIDRGEGALLFGLGSSTHTPHPVLAGPGLGQAGLRNYVLNLHTELAGTGVYAGALTIGKLIARSDAQRTFEADAELAADITPELADPDELAALAWDLLRQRDRAEEMIGIPG